MEALAIFLPVLVIGVLSIWGVHKFFNKVRKQQAERVKLAQSQNSSISNLNTQYPALGIISQVFKVLGVLNLIGGIVAGALLIDAGDSFAPFSVIFFLGSVMSLVVCYAVAEAIKLFIDMSTNINHIRNKVDNHTQ